jgi:hypothetical protein
VTDDLRRVESRRTDDRLLPRHQRHQCPAELRHQYSVEHLRRVPLLKDVRSMEWTDERSKEIAPSTDWADSRPFHRHHRRVLRRLRRLRDHPEPMHPW